ncbi:MAG: hypothetical protein C5B50_10985 [Verrucomicrobia bacterium]|nr:MAG: hypothetical protein C5B50_10985 [Verrucomicrobiota bacterium]
MPDAVNTPAAPPSDRPVDAGSQALSEALKSSFGIIKALMAILFVVFLCSGIFKVGPGETAIKLRLGKVVGQGQQALLKPGLHWSFPYPIEEYQKVSVSGVKKAISSIGWFAISADQELAGNEPPPNPTLNPAVDGYLLTADNNIIHARATLSYHVADPVAFTFAFSNATQAVQSALDNALLAAATHFKVDDILTRDVLAFKDDVRKRVTDLVDLRGLSIVVEDCSIESRPPRQCKDAFESVIKAEIGRNNVHNQATSYANQVTNRAGADAASRINTAQSDRVRYVNDMHAQARRFEELLPKYRENPRLFVEKSMTETVARALTNADDTIFLSDVKGREFRPLLNLPLPKPTSTQQK